MAMSRPVPANEPSNAPSTSRESAILEPDFSDKSGGAEEGAAIGLSVSGGVSQS